MQSRRGDNPLIISIIRSESAASTLRIVEALGQRSDPYMEDIIDMLLNQHSDSSLYEYYLECLLRSILSVRKEQASLWVRTNPKSFDAMANRLDSISNAFLKAHIISLLVFDSSPDRGRILLTAMTDILNEMRDGPGVLNPGRTKELLAIFSTVEQIGKSEFLGILADLIKHSRQARIVKRGREVVEQILGRGD
jgi:hypothetical protein